eukprot:885865-Pyramimonas_sp.AAC.1
MVAGFLRVAWLLIVAWSRMVAGFPMVEEPIMVAWFLCLASVLACSGPHGALTCDVRAPREL